MARRYRKRASMFLFAGLLVAMWGLQPAQAGEPLPVGATVHWHCVKECWPCIHYWAPQMDPDEICPISG